MSSITTALLWFGIVLLGFAFYCAPMIVAFARRHNRAKAIGLLNLLAGWSVLGWIAALVWALYPEKKP